MTPEEEKSLLLRVVVRIAQTQLEKGGFIPFGATLRPGRDVQLLIPKGAPGGNTTIELVNAYWSRQMAKAIESGDVRALCTVADVRESNSDGRLVPGVFIHIEHFSGDAEDLLYLYSKLENSQVRFQEPTRETTTLKFFNVT